MKLALFDRDGTLNVEVDEYITMPEQLRLYPQSLEALALLKRAGFTAAVVTNQSVVGHGLTDEAGLARIHAYMCDTIAAAGGRIDRIYACTDHPDKASYRRKPKPGMILEALEHYGTQAAQTPYVGDSIIDAEAAQAAGCPFYIVMTGKGEKTLAQLSERGMRFTPCMNILDAARKIVERF